MEKKRRIYKHISIISFTIVLILIGNLILPIFTQAEDSDKTSESITITFNVNKSDGIINIMGSIPDGHTKYVLYWANKIYNGEKPNVEGEIPTFVTETINWFNNNKLKDPITVEGKTSINSDAIYEEGKEYSVLCLVYDSDNMVMLSWANYTLADFEEKTELKDSTPEQESDISVELYRITDENYGDIAICATSKTGKITAIKYYISNSKIDLDNEENRNMIKISGTSMTVSGSSKEGIVRSDGEISNDKYITIFVESTDGNYTYEYWDAPGTVGSLNKVEIAPWENGLETEELEIEESKTEESKTEESKTEESKTEGSKTEESKTEESKTEESKTEESKTEDSKTKENQKKENSAEKNSVNNTQSGNQISSNNSSKNVIPQTGSNDNFVITGIIIFSIIGLIGLIKYKKEQ